MRKEINFDPSLLLYCDNTASVVCNIFCLNSSSLLCFASPRIEQVFLLNLSVFFKFLSIIVAFYDSNDTIS